MKCNSVASTAQENVNIVSILDSRIFILNKICSVLKDATE